MFSYSGEKVIDQCGFTAAVMTEVERPAAACSISASEVSRCERYQLTASASFGVDPFPMNLWIHTHRRPG